MNWCPLGDSAWLLRPGGADPADRFAQVLAWREVIEAGRIAEVGDVVPAPDSLAVHTTPDAGETVLDWLTSLPQPVKPGVMEHHGNEVEIPVCYHPPAGSDLHESADQLGITAAELVARHSQPLYTVVAIGFSPGFPYLSGLDPRLHLPRRSSPRPVVAGAVAIAGKQAGIYPFASQGGWHVLGQTDATLFDPHASAPALLRVGDRVRLLPVDRLAQTSPAPPSLPAVEGTLWVRDPGVLTTVQDLGRPGFQHAGVSPGGAADPVAARVANGLVGNPPGAALLECSVRGPLIEFLRPACVATVGWAHRDDGRPQWFAAGQSLDLRGRMRLLRGYLAVAGGIATPAILGSRATDVRACFGSLAGRPLRAGDRLDSGNLPPRSPTAGDWHVSWPAPAASGRPLEIRFLRGMQGPWFSAESHHTFRSQNYQTSPVGDRTGLRLDGPPLRLTEPREMVSQPVVRGSIQVPPDGKPIVLLSECQTIGGYPQIGHVISADLPVLARALPGTVLRFVEVSLAEARAAWRALQRELAMLETSLSFLR